ncbi:hypothetical protein GGI04_003797 [Coemansia thaxteri]|uniref:Uncharacterized protein n=1 Tax=Coemansia thaxteri TaxID=2663907 RepID=A0A9W8EJY7_9FUNG|nr:hypothetical protein GGI04_003797 [Coemansia thaxteri]KAJ2005355.1 hypothetical protein H4R26_001990 [Coemansia thaxteri]KAJ2466408.1 hypothetical protein GGI02_004383 [Coemansia sp. RSA 2322]KAJ2485297.1 hypothetical protein EV174_001817 [Coemansia sp. RSA 2320]
MVTRLQASGFERGQAAVITGIVRQRVQEAMDQVRLGMLSKSDLENDSYLFRAALQELRMEMQMTRKNDQSVLESQAAGISREIESLAQRTNDLIGNLRSDIEIEVSNHKHETSHEMKGMDMELHELATKYQLLMGEMKTDIEAIKLGSIRRGLITVVLTAMFLGAIFWGPHFAHRVRMRRQEKKGQADSEQELNHESVARGRTGGSGRRRPDAGTEEQGAPLPPPPAAFRNHSHLAIQYEPTISQPSEPPMQQEEQAERVRWGQGALDAPMGESDAQLDSAALAGRQEEDG